MAATRLLFLILLPMLLNPCSEQPTATEEALPNVHLYYGWGNELDTFEKTYQKDLVMDGYKKIPFELSAEELGRILDKANEIGFFEYPDTITYDPAVDSLAMNIMPNPPPQFLRIQFEQKDKTVTWIYPLPANSSYLSKLFELKNRIIEIIEAKPEYKALPPPRGARL